MTYDKTRENLKNAARQKEAANNQNITENRRRSGPDRAKSASRDNKDQ